MLSESLENQVSGNEWAQPRIPSIYEALQPAVRPTESRFFYSMTLGDIADLHVRMGRVEEQQDTALAELNKQYVIPSESAVVSLLREHRALPELLLSAMPQLKKHFGDEPLITLRELVDESGERTLYAVVLWSGNVHEAGKALDRFDDTWWTTKSRLASGNLYFTYELV